MKHAILIFCIFVGLNAQTYIQNFATMSDVNPLPSPWTTITQPLQKIGTGVTATVDQTPNSMYYNATTPNDQREFIVIKSVDAVLSYNISLLIRCQGASNNGYHCQIHAFSHELRLYVNNSGFSLLDSKAVSAFAAGDTVWAWAVGNVIKFAKNHTDTVSVTDNTFASGFLGINNQTNLDTISYWQGGEISSCTPPTLSYAVKKDTSCVASTHTPTVAGSPDSIGFIGTWGSRLTSFNHSTGEFVWTPIDTLIAKPCSTIAYKTGCENVTSVCSLKVVYGTIQLDSITPRHATGRIARTVHGRAFRIYADSIHVTGPDSLAPVTSCTNTDFVFTPPITADTGWRDTFIVSNGITADTIFDTAYHIDQYVLPQYTLTVATTGIGTSTPATGNVDSGAVININNTPASGWGFKSWSASGGATLGSEVTVKANTVTLAAAGSATALDTATYVYSNITVSAVGGGSATPSGAQSVQCLTDLNIAATDAAGHHFTAWTYSPNVGVDEPGNASTHCATTDSATGWVKANFDTTRYTLTMAAGAGGSVSPVTGSVDSGISTAISATVLPGKTWYTWDRWTRSSVGAVIADTSLATTALILKASATVTGNWKLSTVAVPTLYKPDSTTADSISKMVTFLWRKAAADSFYILQVDTAVDFSSARLTTDSTTDTSKTKTLTDTTRYYWRVYGQNSGGKSAESKVWTFWTDKASGGGVGGLAIGALGLGILGVGIFAIGKLRKKLKSKK
jgi:hypothetical protein